jgi:hypothetical protein
VNGHGPFYIQAGAASYSLYMSNNGNVGIGSTTPAAKLEVNGTGKFDGLVTFVGGQTFPGTGTITGVTPGAGLSGGGSSGSVSLGLQTCTTGQVLVSNGAGYACGTVGGGNGTVTSVGTGSGLTGGPITTSGTISIAAGGVSNTMLANPSLTVTAGTGLSGGGSVALGGSTSLSIASASCSSNYALVGLPFSCQQFPTLGSNNFGGTQNVTVSSGDAIQAISNAAPDNGSAGFFQNTNGGSILQANDGNDDLLKVDTSGVQIRRTINQIPNDPVSSTVLNDLVTADPATGNAKLAGPGYSGSGPGVIGIVVANAGTSSQFPEAMVAFYGDTQCNFDNTAVGFDFVQISPTTAGQCHDAGSTYPAVGQVMGVVTDPGKSPPEVFLLGPGVVGGTGVIATSANCSSSASPAVCGSDGAGSVVIAAAGTTVQVNTTAVTANSQIMLQEDRSLGTKLGVTCNTTAGRTYMVSARTAGTSFTISASGAPSATPACLSYVIVN